MRRNVIRKEKVWPWIHAIHWMRKLTLKLIELKWCRWHILGPTCFSPLPASHFHTYAIDPSPHSYIVDRRDFCAIWLTNLLALSFPTHATSFFRALNNGRATTIWLWRAIDTHERFPTCSTMLDSSTTAIEGYNMRLGRHVEICPSSDESTSQRVGA